MRTIIFTLALLALTFGAKSQDLIVTNAGDSMNCTIIKIKGDVVYFSIKKGSETSKSQLPVSMVKRFQYSYYQSEGSTPVIVVNRDSIVIPKYRFTIMGGMSYWAFAIYSSQSTIEQNYLKKMQIGYTYGLEGSYYCSKHWGFGVKYSGFNSSSKLTNMLHVGTAKDTSYVTLSDKIAMHFIGSFVSGRMFSRNKRHSVYDNLGLGYLYYQDDINSPSYSKLHGGTYSLLEEIGCDMVLNKHFTFTCSLSAILGTLRSYTLVDGSSTSKTKLGQSDYSTLNHYDATIGVSYSLFK
jgi:hypothetical protein